MASATRISALQLRHADRLSPGRLNSQAEAEFDLKPSPLSPGHVRIIATANLTVLSVNSSHTGFTGGSLLNLQAIPSDILLTWLLQLAGKYTHYTLSHKHHFIKLLETLWWERLVDTNTHALLVHSTTTGIFVRL